MIIATYYPLRYFFALVYPVCGNEADSKSGLVR